MMKVLSIFGTRPEAIKMAPVIKELERQPGYFRSRVCVTAQHRQMLDQVLSLFEIKPDRDLNIMRKDQTLYDITASGLLAVKEVVQKEKPDMVLVQGDTTTTLVGSLAAYYEKIPVGHVEAGLRTNDKYRPFPEEINRRLTTQIADLHFAPTEWARENLLKEGIEENRIFVTGNTVVDALLMIAGKQSAPESQRKWENYFYSEYGISLNNGKKPILVTGHRRESFGQGFENICHAIKEIAASHRDVSVIYPIHLNPNVQEPVQRILRDRDNVHLIPPLDYEPFVYLMTRAYLILTDSGGIQEEAPSLGKPVLVLRETTERPEGVEAGTAKLVGTNRRDIVENAIRLVDNQEAYRAMANIQNPYGDGASARRIVDHLILYCRNVSRR